VLISIESFIAEYEDDLEDPPEPLAELIGGIKVYDQLFLLHSRLLMDLIDDRVRGEYMAMSFPGNTQLAC
jgi:hypothetical protein